MKLEEALEELESAVRDVVIASTHLKMKSKEQSIELAKTIIKEKRALDALRELRVELKDAMILGGQVG
jgi:hypothetical protein